MASVEATVTVSGTGQASQPDSDALYYAALLLIGRLHYRGDAPLGIAGSFDLGAIYIRARDPDVAALLVGHRGAHPSTDQTWPDVATVRARWNIGSAVTDAEIQSVIDAVITMLSKHVSSFGVA